MTSLRETVAEQPKAEQVTFTPLLQGLILGLGIGATFATVFVVRGARSATPAPEAAHVSEEHSVSTPPEVNAQQPSETEPTENSNPPDGTGDNEERS